MQPLCERVARLAGLMVVAGLAAPSAVQQQPPRSDAVATTLTGTAIVRGTVADGVTGLPIPRAAIDFLRQPTDVFPATADAAGRFERRDLPAGTYRVRVSKPGYLESGTLARAERTSEITVDVAEGAIVERLTLTLVRGAAIEGRVVDEHGDPVPHASVSPVQLRSSGDPVEGSQSQTDDRGRFRVFGLPPGSYALKVNVHSRRPGSGSTAYSSTYFPGVIDLAAAESIAVRVAEEIGDIEIRLRSERAFSVTGRVLTSRGEPAAGLLAMLERGRLDDQLVQPVFLAADARFRFDAVPPGSYQLVVSRLPLPFSSGKPGESASIDIVVDRNVENLEVVTSPPRIVRGEVIAETGPPPSTLVGMDVSAADPHGDMPPSMTEMFNEVQISKDHTFDFVVPRRPRLVRIEPLPEGWRIGSVEYGGKDVTDIPTLFDGPAEATLRIVLTKRSAHLTGAVRGEDEKPATSGSLLMFSEDEARWFLRAVTSRIEAVKVDGTFRVTGLPAGEYWVIAMPSAAAFFSGEPSLFGRLREKATRVRLVEGTDQSVILRLQSAIPR